MKPIRFWLVLPIALLSGWAGPASGYRLDAGNTRLSFTVYRFGLRWMTAAFRDVSGTFVLNGQGGGHADDEGGGAYLNVTVRTESVDCADAQWSEHLRSPEWLDTRKYPEMTYSSTRIEFDGNSRAKVYGELSLHGVSRSVMLTVVDIDCGPSLRADVSCQFSGRGQIKRSDFNLPHGFWQGGDAVEISVRGQ